MTASTIDIMMELDNVISQYGKDKIRGLYIDYLDLLRTDIKFDLYRIELGFITLSLKTLAVQYNIPVISVTQLGRGVYNVQASKDLNLDLMSESIKKVEHSDFVALLSKDPVDENIVHMKIGKNRSGKANIIIDFKVDFKTYRFLNGIKTSGNKKNVSSYTNEHLLITDSEF